MPRRSLVWHLFSSHLFVTLVAIIVLELLALRLFTSFGTHLIATDLEVRARLVTIQVQPLIDKQETSSIQELCRELGKQTATRYTVILPDGTVVGDSEEEPAKMDNHGNRPEVQQALQTGQNAQIERFSHTLNKQMLYVAIPLTSQDKQIAVVRASMALTSISKAFFAVQRNMGLAGLLVLGMTSVVSWFVSRRITAPLNSMKAGAERFARGELLRPIPEPSAREMADLAVAINQMASELNNRISEVGRRQKEQEAVFSSMVEGVLAVDRSCRILTMNRAAADLLNIRPEESFGKDVREITRSAQIRKFILDVIESQVPLERELTLSENENQVLQAHGAALRDTDGKEFGVVIVLHDITRIRRLEALRRDFVGNVSHELRTPVTSIKGFVETLLDGAKDNPEENERFLRIIARHADRLNTIIEDLLTLSRIERETEAAALPLESVPLQNLVQNAVDLCVNAAKAKDIALIVRCPDDVVIRVNPSMIEQAIVNLLDNAIKYSGNSETVEIEAGLNGSEAYIRVTDHGIGIPEEHLPRLFERFYRVDKARSRNLGGTGLGLAIVKHIVQAHKGRITVDSQIKKGSTFTLFFPLNLVSQNGT